MSSLTISGKAIGSRRPLFADWSIPFPPDWGNSGGVTLRDLIGQVVRGEVQKFKQRQEDRQIFRALTVRQNRRRSGEALRRMARHASAFLARDNEIQDPTILEQLRR